MTGFVTKRLLWVVPVLLGITLVVFALMKVLPGDPALSLLGPYATEARVAELRKSLGLDRSLPAQYGLWLGGLLRGDFGHSYALDRPVRDLLGEHLGPTFLLAGTGLLLGSCLGLSLGAVAACHQGKRLDRLLTGLSLLGVSTPSFWLAMLLMLALGIWWPAFPVSGMRTSFGESGPADVARHLVLPSASLAVVIAGVIARLMRTTMLSVLRSDHLQTARALGTPEGVVRYRHAFSVALAAMIPVIGLQAGFALGGAVYVESVFQWPGLGRLLVDAVGKRDLLLVQGTVVVVAASYVLVNLVADLLQGWLDPRIAA